MKRITQHNANAIITPLRIGFKSVFHLSYSSGVHPEGFNTFFEAWRLLWWAIQVFVILLSIVLVHKMEDYEAMAFGLVPVFFLVAATYYYYIMLLVAFFMPQGIAGLFEQVNTKFVEFQERKTPRDVS